MRAAVVPTRNEYATVGPLVRRLQDSCDMVIVADDSDDLTSLAALSEGATVIDPPAGIGPAYLDAWKKIPPDWDVIHVDAGGSHPIVSVERVAHSPGDIVIGSRFMRGGRHDGTLRRRVSSRAASAAMNLITFRGLTDWTSGLRKYSPRARALLQDVQYQTTGHAWQIESLYAATQHGLTVVEVPIVYLPSDSSLNVERVREAVSLWWSITWK